MYSFFVADNPPPVRSTGIKTGALVGVVFGCLFAGAFVVLAIVFVVRWKQPTKQKTQKSMSSINCIILFYCSIYIYLT